MNAAITDLDAATLATMALRAHDAACRECGSPTSDSRCPAGDRYEDATRPDRTWVRDYEGN